VLLQVRFRFFEIPLKQHSNYIVVDKSQMNKDFSLGSVGWKWGEIFDHYSIKALETRGLFKWHFAKNLHRCRSHLAREFIDLNNLGPVVCPHNHVPITTDIQKSTHWKAPWILNVCVFGTMSVKGIPLKLRLNLPKSVCISFRKYSLQSFNRGEENEGRFVNNCSRLCSRGF